MKRRIGIFGGTFNPPHIGHVRAAKSFVEKMALDELIIMPAFIPPHKEYDDSVTCESRLEMCRIAFKDVPKSTVSDLEISRGGKSYTYITLQELSEQDAELYFLCGTDMLLTMDSWKNPDVIFSLANICYIRRESDGEVSSLIEQKSKEYLDKYGAGVIPIDSEAIEISSTEIRSDILNASKYISDDIMKYILKEGLYQ